jgi:exopolysaccharide biosynthesis polyprenyl glycosylphosphotransferase
MPNPRHLQPSSVEERQMRDVTPAKLGGHLDLPVIDVLPDRDMRAKRPPLLSFLLRWSTLRRGARIVSLLALDLGAIVLAIFTALCLKAAARDAWEPSVSWEQAKDYVPFAFLVASLLFARSGLYAERAQRPGLTRIVASLFQTTLVALIFAVVNGEEFSSYYIFYGTLFFAVAYVSTARYAYEQATGWLLRTAGYKRRAVLVGTGEQIEAVAHALLASGGSAPVNVIGFVSLTPRPDNGLRSLGALEDIGDIVGDHKVDEVIIADPAFPQQRALELVDTCHQRGVVVRIAPSTMEILIHRAEFVPGQSVPLFELKPPVFDGIDFAVKRSFDLAVSSVLLLLLSPLFAICAALVKLTSRGPVLYQSWRPGIGGAPFACLKFRTMYADADRRQAELEEHNEASGALFKMRHDPRVTKVGRLLRRFSIDELPQLINVLRGDMSLVGPRPLPQRDFDRLEEWHKKRYLVLPGITGLWQVSGRSDLDFDDLVRLDFLYLERWSVFLDLTILVKTVPAVFTRRGAF